MLAMLLLVSWIKLSIFIKDNLIILNIWCLNWEFDSFLDCFYLPLHDKCLLWLMRNCYHLEVWLGVCIKNLWLESIWEVCVRSLEYCGYLTNILKKKKLTCTSCKISSNGDRYLCSENLPYKLELAI